MPLADIDLRGKEKDGSRSDVYCRYCYRNGEFTYPGMTLDEMRSHLQELMRPSEMSKDQVESLLAGLPKLKRWTDAGSS